MKRIGPPDTYYLSAAQGWFELGNYKEAKQELKRISAELQQHPDVLQARWTISAKLQEWTDCLEIGKEMITQAPELPLGWINKANALFYLKRTQEAYDFLLPILDRFPKNFVIPYNLACYTCQLGQIEEARSWLSRAIQLGEKSRIVSTALNDSDLTPLWDEIRKM